MGKGFLNQFVMMAIIVCLIVTSLTLPAQGQRPSGIDWIQQFSTVEPPIKDPPRKGQPPNNGHIAWHQTYGCSVI